MFNDPRSATFSTLAIDTDDCFICAANVFRVERKIRDLPKGRGAGALAHVEAFLDGILVRATEGACDKLSTVRSSWMYRDLVALLNNFDNMIDVREVNFRMNSLRLGFAPVSLGWRIASL